MGNNSRLDGNILRRYTDGFLCKSSITGAFVHMYKKGLAEGRIYVRAKATQGWVLQVLLPLAPRSPYGPRGGKKISPLSCSHLTVRKGIASQCFLYFWHPTTWKMATFIFSFKGKSCTVQPKAEPLQLFIRSINLIFLCIFSPLKYFVLVEYI